MFGYFGDFGFYGDAVSDLKQKINATDRKRALTQQKMWKAPLFSAKRRKLEIQANQLVLKVRKLRLELSEMLKKKGSGKSTADAVADVNASIRRRRFPMPALRRAGPRPVLPPMIPPAYRPMPGEYAPPSRVIDPLVPQQSIDPRFVARNLGPFPPGRSIDPVIPQVGLVPGLGPQGGSFTFPPGNITDTDIDVDSLEDAELSGGFDLSASNPWVIGGVALAALYVVPKLFKKGAAPKTNPRRRRRNRRR